MGLLSSSAPSADGYSNPGNPVKDLVSFGDQVRGTVLDLPILVVVTAMLYNMAFIQGEEGRSWSVGDAFMVLLIAYLLKRTGVGARWRGVF